VLYSTGYQSSGKNCNLGHIEHPNHPIMQGVNTFDGGSCTFFNPGKVAENARLIASYQKIDTLLPTPLVAELITPKGEGKVIGLNMVPISAKMDDRLWKPETDGHVLMANSLLYTNRTNNQRYFV